MPWLNVSPYDLPPPSAAERAAYRLDRALARIHAGIDMRCREESARDRLRWFTLRDRLARARREVVIEIRELLLGNRCRFLLNRQTHFRP